MVLEEKKKRFKMFINDEYSNATFHYLNMYKSNSFLFLRIIELKGILIEKLNKGEIKHKFDKPTLLSIKHIILLDALSKLMMLLEAFFALNFYLMRDLKRLPINMIKYGPSTTYEFIKKVESKSIKWNDIWQIFAFPNIDNLNINKKEKLIISQVLKNSSKYILSNYRGLINFYKNHLILYNKFKHGFSFIPGLEEVKSKDSFIMALDRKKTKQEIRGKVRCSKMLYYGFYNTYSIKPFNKKSFKDISKHLSNLQSIIEHLVDNHHLKGFNCGIDFMPKSLFLNKDFPKRKYYEFQQIIDKKVAPVLYNPSLKVSTEISAKKEFKEIMEKMFEENIVAAFWTNPGRKRLIKGRLNVKKT